MTNTPKTSPGVKHSAVKPSKQDNVNKVKETKEQLRDNSRKAKEEASKRRDNEKTVMQLRSARGQPKLGLQTGVLLEKIKRREQKK